jgi:hypothetical protein
MRSVPEHKSSKYGYGPHPMDCPACAEAAERRYEWRLANNPHRPGTKAHATWDKQRGFLDWALDLRGETYWSM